MNTLPPSPVKSIALFSTLLVASLSASRASGEQPPTKVIAWKLGTKIGLAAAGRETGAPDRVIDGLIKDTNVLAGALGVQIPQLPENIKDESSSEFAARTFLYLVSDLKPCGAKLLQNHGQEEAALFEIGVKSGVMLIIFAGEERDSAFADMIESRSRRAGLPSRLWQPLVDAIRQQRPYGEMKAALVRMNEDVSRHLLD